jgi:hypothetical protein
MTKDKRSEILRLRETNKRYENALRLIRYSKYCLYSSTRPDMYGIGVTDGHRYCAEIAGKALDEMEQADENNE